MDPFQELVPVIYGSNGINFLRLRYDDVPMPISPHWHNRIELLHIISGSLEVYLDGVHATTKPRQTVIIMPNIVHCALTDSGIVEYYVISFDPQKFCNETIASLKYIQPLFQEKVSFCPVATHPKVANAMEELIALLAAQDVCNPLCAIGKIYEIIGLFYQYCSVETVRIHKTDKRFKEALTYINNHYTESISTQNISKRFGYEEAYFCRKFKETTGTGVIKYIRYLRLSNAQHLLRLSEENIRDVALKCGFSDISYFCSCFKHQFGMSPKEFRKQKG